MSSYKKRQKTLKRTHRERSQIHSRQHLGLLEKHKDYVLRAKDYARKKAELKLLHEKARNRNPDEFYYKMIKNKLKDKRHVIAQEEEKYSVAELQLMKTQDEKYIQMKLATENKKIERLRSCLHHTTEMKHSPPNRHIVFVDSMEEATKYKEAHETAQQEQDRARKDRARERRQQNRAREGGKGKAQQDGGGSGDNSESRNYKELKQRTQRCKQLQQVAAKMKRQKDLMGKGRRIKIKGNGSTPTVYKWKVERSR